MALVAIAAEGGVEREVGVCRYFALPDGASCEYAIVIADAWQGRGLGRAMLSRLARIARDQGLATMEGIVLAGNAAMLALCASLGFESRPEEGDPQLVRVQLDLATGR
jgi:acetyltransferase